MIANAETPKCRQFLGYLYISKLSKISRAATAQNNVLLIYYQQNSQVLKNKRTPNSLIKEPPSSLLFNRLGQCRLCVPERVSELMRMDAPSSVEHTKVGRYTG